MSNSGRESRTRTWLTLVARPSAHRGSPPNGESAPGLGADTPPRKLLYTPEEAMYMLSIGRPRLFELIRTRELPSVKLGRSRRISARALQGYVQRLEDDRTEARHEHSPAECSDSRVIS